MRKLSKKGILPVAAVLAALNYLCHAQGYSANQISHIQAIEVVSQLKKGMQEQDVEQYFATNHLSNCWGGVGDNFAWNRYYSLTDNCELLLGYTGDDWGKPGTKSSLQGACIVESNRTIISIPLVRIKTNDVVQTTQTNSVPKPTPAGP